MYGAECWPATKEVERSLSVMETKMLRCTAGVTHLDHVRNVFKGLASLQLPISYVKLAYGGTAMFFVQMATPFGRLAST
ncbi:unnamed protein product [Heligmosomoides polygyrus]|uniref:Uncharacterized protein n=1 Tax=Heligmosomoides polygyrus TaxID=6339 RepID=A0A183FY39_HELPZ|nr:unnamed protein product [Heligmosomoides polygyrus]